jgi:hypothetical protein
MQFAVSLAVAIAAAPGGMMTHVYLARALRIALAAVGFGGGIVVGCASFHDTAGPDEGGSDAADASNAPDSAIDDAAVDGGPRCTFRAPADSGCSLYALLCEAKVLSSGTGFAEPQAQGIAVDDSHLYWVEQYLTDPSQDPTIGAAPGVIARVPKRGGDRELITDELSRPTLAGLASDAILFTSLVDGGARRLESAAKSSCTPSCTAIAPVYEGVRPFQAFPVSERDVFFWQPYEYYRRVTTPGGYWIEGPHWITDVVPLPVLGPQDFFMSWPGAPRIERIGLADPLDAGPTAFVATADGGALGEIPLTADCKEFFTMVPASNMIRAYDLATGRSRDVRTVSARPASTVQDEIFLYFATAEAGAVIRLRKSGDADEEILMKSTNSLYLAIDDEALYIEEHTGVGNIYRMAK